MTQLTERYLAASVRGLPEAQRTDVERELRSSIADALEDRVTAGEDRVAAEKAVLEGLGDPVRLAAGIAGRPLHLIGPDLFVEYPVMLALAAGVLLVTAWEIYDPFRRARRADARATGIGEPGQAAR
ncbi:MAG: permease prefix domain 1-containing protein [Candidatus Limnocylindria bacterium]